MKHNLIQLGYGNVGRALVAQIRTSGKSHAGIELAYCGLFTSDTGISNPAGLSASEITSFPSGSSGAIDAILNVPLPFTLIDATSSGETLPQIQAALQRGGSVALANKRPLAGTQAVFDALMSAGTDRIFFETTVGAGLPIISALQDMIQTGDEILEISGCFSGTLGYIFSQLDAGVSYSAAVSEALRLGFTEADPREDLSGMDVARKAVILSRLIGRRIEPESLAPEQLFPTNMSELTVPEFMKRLPELDEDLAKRFKEASRQKSTLRYVASVSPKQAGVGLKTVASATDIGALSGPDNIAVIRTARYKENPLVVKGPGAGPEVTAAGLYGDILRAARSAQMAAKQIVVAHG